MAYKLELRNISKKAVLSLQLSAYTEVQLKKNEQENS